MEEGEFNKTEGKFKTKDKETAYVSNLSRNMRY